MPRNIPRKTIQRVLLYHRYLTFLLQQGTRDISSKSLADILETKPSQVRKDLSYFGKFGTQGAGYDVLELRDRIGMIMGIQKIRKICIVGMGNLGEALAGYKGLDDLGFKVSAVFDNSKQKIGRKIKGFRCHDIGKLYQIIKKDGIELAVLTVPAAAAQEVARRLEKAGIKAILNFTPVKLTLSNKVKISNVDLAVELKTLSFFVR
ncbi:MAG: redox-sensing transcriptional repressor Rex [Candidatus Saganbacteria bacterium]|nr:redox-sensing transcriptional repressor Rex [Candidatus Saganbacteria bacterium]